ncbi:MAG: polysaccharide lyase 6 family protein [Verrucomicrobiales bacterium]|nr:polysaccharide lyase 6 family protein [Verrucomicrobiales bacterium]
MNRILSLAFVFFFLHPGTAEEFHVSNPEEFDIVAKKAAGGDVVVLKDGTWNDARLEIKSSGESDAPITIKAETPGKVIFTGDSRISLGGRHLVVEGMWFQNPTGEESIEFRADSKNLARDCRVTNCAVTNDDAKFAMKGTSRFLSVYGSGHRIDHCYFAGKTTGGPTAVIWLAEDPDAPASHRIDHNHFGPREKLGKNGGETIRLGDSSTSMITAGCLVEDNLFEKCNGEAECISNKSCGNTYRGNYFVEVSGALTLRHGNNCFVEGNHFLGGGAKGTGGVRVIGEGHVVTGNHFQDLRGDDERSALCVMMGIPNSPANGYFQVKGAKITKNRFLNCEENFLIGLQGDSKAKLPPIESVISENRIQTNKGKAFEIQCDASGVKMEGNTTGEEPFEAEVTAINRSSVGPEWWKH